jgi:hypothetical protein
MMAFFIFLFYFCRRHNSFFYFFVVVKTAFLLMQNFILPLSIFANSRLILLKYRLKILSSPKLYNEKGLTLLGEFEFRQPITEVDDCNIADVLFISQIYNVQPELKHNKEQMLK